MPMLPNKIPKRTLRFSDNKSVKLKVNWKMSKGLKLQPEKLWFLLKGKLTLPPMLFEEARTLLEPADRARRTTEQELSDTNKQLSDLTCTNQAIAGVKRKLESGMQTLHSDLDEMTQETTIANQKS